MKNKGITLVALTITIIILLIIAGISISVEKYDKKSKFRRIKNKYVVNKNQRKRICRKCKF